MAKPQKTEGTLSSAPPRAGSRSEGRHSESIDVPGTKTVALLEPETSARRRKSGPRTAVGKQRSRLNAQTHGIFSRGRIVGDESPREFELLLEGLVDDLKPQGTLERILVDQLATILWRRHRILRAESAEIEKAINNSLPNMYLAQTAEVWERVRAGEATGGILKQEDNPLVLREAIFMLTIVRSELETCGFREDPWMLRRLYGLDTENSAPCGTLFHLYLNLRNPKGVSAQSEEDRKKIMLDLLDQEIKRLEQLRDLTRTHCLNTIEYDKHTHAVPPLAVSERFLRYETHLSREFDRTLTQLERLRRMRLGQPVVPPINVRLSR